MRAIEHRIAAARHAAAQKQVADLLGISTRLENLRASLRLASGQTCGASLQATSELHGRLARAESALQQPIRQAEDRSNQARTARLLAQAQEDGAERLREKAAAREQQDAALREDANRPARRTKERRS